MESSEALHDEEERRLDAEAQELELAICSLFDASGHREKQQLANQWLNQFVGTPRAWTVSLYLAFPPVNSGVRGLQEVRFFALNLLLSKIRNDWVQLSQQDAQEIYETLVQQLPLIRHDSVVASRLSIVVCAAAAVVGEVACYELIESIIGSVDVAPILERSFGVDLLIALAEEALSRSRALSAEVGRCLQDCCSQVLQYLDNTVSLPDQSGDILPRVLTCLERWISAGVTLSEVFSDNHMLFQSMIHGLGSPSEACFDAAVAASVELVSAVDPLPGRHEAMRAIAAAILANRGAYLANVGSPTATDSPFRKRALGLCTLLGATCVAEAPLVAKGEYEATELLNWLVDASGGGGGLGVEGAMRVVDAWPRLVAVPAARRAEILQIPLFARAAQAVMQVTMYPEDFESWEVSETDEDNFYRFRESFAEEVLGSLYREVGAVFLQFILEKLQLAATWQIAEVCVFAAAALRDQLRSDMKLPDKTVAVNSFVQTVISQMPGRGAVTTKDKESLPHGRMVETAVTALGRYAEWTASDSNLLGIAVQYSLGALYVSDARGQACEALREICRAAAPHIAAAQALAPLMSECEAAGLSMDIEVGERLAMVQALAIVAAALPPTESRPAFARLTASAAATLRTLSVSQERAEATGKALSCEIRVFSAVLDCGANEIALQEILPVLQEIWPVLDSVATNWAADSEVASSLCELWAILARKVGMLLAGWIPDIIARATAMFKQHLRPVCLECLCDVVALSSKGLVTDQTDITHSLSSMLLEITRAIPGFERILEATDVDRGSANSTNVVPPHKEKKAKWQENAADILGAVCRLGRTFLHNQPVLLLPSPGFPQIVQCSIGCIKRKELGPALAAANFLADVIFCSTFSEEDLKDMTVWRLPQELVPHVDQVVSLCGVSVVEVVVSSLASSPTIPQLREAVAMVLYALCSRYGVATRAAMSTTLMSIDFPVRPGLLTEADKNMFIDAAVRQPLHPRRRFQELIADFCNVCQGLMPAETLGAYCS